MIFLTELNHMVFCNFTEKQQNIINKAKEIITEATAKCKDLEDKMKVQNLELTIEPNYGQFCNI